MPYMPTYTHARARIDAFPFRDEARERDTNDMLERAASGQHSRPPARRSPALNAHRARVRAGIYVTFTQIYTLFYAAGLYTQMLSRASSPTNPLLLLGLDATGRFPWHLSWQLVVAHRLPKTLAQRPLRSASLCLCGNRDREKLVSYGQCMFLCTQHPFAARVIRQSWRADAGSHLWCAAG